MTTLKRFLFLIAITAGILIPDQWTKAWAVRDLKGNLPTDYLWGTIRIIYAENTGAWGNLGGDWPPFLRMSFLIALPVIILLGLAIFVIVSKKVTRPERWAYAFIVAGGAGNLIDRIRYDYVVDFLWMGIGPIGTNIFNIADVSIMIGFGIMVLLNILEWKNKRRETALAGPEK
jgi:signal peptidase II